MDVGPTFYWEFPYFGMATGLPVLFCKTVVPVLDSAVLIRPAGTGDSGLRLCGAIVMVVKANMESLVVRLVARLVASAVQSVACLNPVRWTPPICLLGQTLLLV